MSCTNNAADVSPLPWLPECIWSSILIKLTPLSGDYFRFGAVCKDWYNIMTNHRKGIRSRTQIPLLMIPSTSNVETRRSFYDITQSKRFDSLHPRVPFNNIKACGSSYGWLIYVEKDRNIVLYNPFVTPKDRTHPSRRDKKAIGRRIDLPPVMEAPLSDEYERGIERVMLFGNPSVGEDYVVLALYRQNAIAILKSWLLPKRWLYLKDIHDHISDEAFTDAIFHQGLIYVINVDRGIFTIDAFSNKDDDYDSFEMKQVFEWCPKTGWNNWKCFYLVESSKGELLVIKRYLKEQVSIFNPETEKFKVYKLCNDPETGVLSKKVKIDNLDGDAVFVGDGGSICVSSTDFDHCQPNCIYFTDDVYWYYLRPGRFTPFGPHDMGIFSLEDNNIKPHYPYNYSHMYLPPSIWYSPMF